MISFIMTAVFSFISTEIDNILVMTILFAQNDGKIRKSQVVVGQYLSLGTLTAISIMGAYGLTFIPQAYIGFFGLIPIVLGIKEYITYKCEKKTLTSKGDEEPVATKVVNTGVLSVTLVALANGADNIGIYIPIFAGYSPNQLSVAIAVFMIMMALWCLLAELIVRIPAIKTSLQKYSDIIVPVVFISLGLYIFIANMV